MNSHRPITIAGPLLLLTFFYSQAASAQICGPASIDYLIRDAKGVFIDASTLVPANFVKESPEQSSRSTSEISFPEGSTAIVTSLSYSGSGDCILKLEELTLKVGGKIMRLIFHLSLNSYNDSAHSNRVIDSLPFQEGTFTLEPSAETNIPAIRWKPMK